MNKKLLIIAAIIVCLLSLMFAEYRYIMHHITPSRGENGTLYLEIFNWVDEYYVE